MQNSYPIYEINDEELNTIVGGSLSYTHTDAQVSVQASAEGGQFHMDTVAAKTQSFSITSHGESASAAAGATVAIAV